MPHDDYTADVLIVGAGMAGLAAASELQRTGYEVLILEKGRGVGGRLATRRVGGATFDHGAQFMTARHPRFAAAIEGWLQAGAAQEWYRGSDDEHPRWRGTPTMTAVAKHLARDVRVLLEKRVASLHLEAAGWVATMDGGETLSAGAVVLTPPVPQSLALLASGGIDLPAEMSTRLGAIDYERCLAVMAVLDGPSQLPPPGVLAPAEGPIAWISDNLRKGVSDTPAVTLHATAAFSLEHWDRDHQQAGADLLRAAAPWLGAGVAEFQVHGWRYSKPIRVEARTCEVLHTSPPLLLAGDAFGGPRVEGAVLSGWAAAEALQKMTVTTP